MTVWIVIPCRGPELGKSRLALALNAGERASLTMSMLGHVLAAAVALDDAQVLVVTPSVEVEALAAKVGARVLREIGSGLNVALGEARDMLRKEGVETMTVIAADLPEVTTPEIGALIAARRFGVAIAPDRHGTGTNGLSIPLAPDLPFAFGQSSRAAHASAAERLGLAVSVVERPGLARDIDVPADLGRNTGK